MSLARMAYYSAVIGGWCAFFAWMVCEYLFLSQGGGSTFQVIVAAGIVGGAIGAGLNAVAGMSNGGLYRTLQRLGPGLVGGAIGGSIGGLIGNVMFSVVGMPRAIGWVIMGLGIGVVEGLYEKSPSKLRNGLIGGGLGGLAGGILFDILPNVIRSNSGMSSRAIGFVILGLCIGAFIGLAQVVLREAWLTVVDGYRVGRQLILSSPVTVLGRGDHLPLPFIGAANTELEKEHLSIERRESGSYFVRDLATRLGTFVNGNPVYDEVELHDGDTIKLAGNFVRFNNRQRHIDENSQGSSSQASPQKTTVPLPPPQTRKTLPPPPSVARSNSTTQTPNPSTTRITDPQPKLESTIEGIQSTRGLPPPPGPKPSDTSAKIKPPIPTAVTKPKGPNLPPPPPKKSS